MLNKQKSTGDMGSKRSTRVTYSFIERDYYDKLKAPTVSLQEIYISRWSPRKPVLGLSHCGEMCCRENTSYQLCNTWMSLASPPPHIPNFDRTDSSLTRMLPCMCFQTRNTFPPNTDTFKTIRTSGLKKWINKYYLWKKLSRDILF